MRTPLIQQNQEKNDLQANNQAYQGKRSMNSQVFSTTKIKQQLKEKDVEDWVNQIKFPQSKNYEYPSDLSLAEIHRQSCYIQKEKSFTQNISKCECCQQKIRFKQHEILTADMYEVIKHDYGISTPLYFSILKLHIAILIVLGLSFGIYFCYLTSKICSDDNFWLITSYSQQEILKICKIQYSTYILPQEIIVDYQVWKGHHFSYLIFTFVCFLSIMMTPFMHEIVIRAHQIKYWSYEQINHTNQDKLTLYIKHLPKKFSEIEILIYIHSALQNECKDNLNGNPLTELVYIYDTHRVKEINQQRKLNYIKFLIVSQKLKEDINNTHFKDEFIELIVLLMYQTKEINAVMKAGFPFTNKAIIKLKDRKVADQVYNHYSKSIFKRMITSSRAMLGQAEEYKKQQLKLELSQPGITDIQSNLENSALKDFPASYLTQTSQSDNEGNTLTRSLVDIMEFSHQFEIEMPEQIDENKDLSVQRGFKQDDIYWENIGMHTIRRFFLRVLTTSVSLIFGSISILLYCFLFTMQQYSDSVIYEKLFAFGIVFVSVFSSIIVVIMTMKSKRSTYSLQEKNINTFTIPTSFFCVVCFPYILALWWAGGFRDINAIYTLFLLSRIRIISKGFISMFHIRWISYWYRKRKIIKSFNKFNYFQNELNQLMTPPYFPIRSRISYTFFVFSTGLLMLLLGPFILVFCIMFQLILYFYDKHSILNVYRVDKQFTFELLSYLIKVMQIIMMPVYAYVYISLLHSVINQAQKYDLLYNYEYHFLIASFLIAGTLFLVYIFLRKQIADFFVFKILGYKINCVQKNEIVEKSYYESYQDYFDKLAVEELTKILIDTFKCMPYQ